MPSVGETAVGYSSPIVEDAEDIALREALESSPDATLEKFVEKEDEPKDPEETTTEPPKEVEKTPDAKETKPEEKLPDRAAKDESRYARNRREFDEEKARVRAELEAEKAQIQRERAEIMAQRQPVQKPDYMREEEIDLTPAKPKFRGNKIIHGDQEYGVKELTAVVENSLANGDVEGAKQVIAVRDKLIARDTLYQFHQEDAQHEQRFNNEITQAIAADPTLNDPNNEVAKNALELHGKLRDAFKRVDGGFGMIVQAAKTYAKAARVDAAEARALKAEARVKELEGKTGLAGSPPSKKASGAKSAADLDDDELYEQAKSELEGRLANRY